MVKQLDRIVVVDVESTCWDGPPPEGMTSEIIEIGVCTVDLVTLARAERRGIQVRPARSVIGPFCTQLTGWTSADFATAGNLRDGCAALRRDYASDRRIWASWGDYDRRQFERNCELHDVRFPFGPTHVNVKTLFALGHSLEREVSVEEAMSILSTPFEGRPHRGEDDAWNIAWILSALIAGLRGATSRGRAPGN